MKNAENLKNKMSLKQDFEVPKSSQISENCILEGKVQIGENCIITNSTLIDCRIDNNVKIENSKIEDSVICSNVTIGPYAHIRNNSFIGENVRIGNFVEIKNSRIGKNTKLAHLTYVGDAEIGDDVNFGCGVVCCNYNGYEKNKTFIGNRVFIGSNVNLVAPLILEDETFIAAGTTVTQNVDRGDFVIGRVRQEKKSYENLYLKNFMKPLSFFGTDGIRGIYGEDLNEELAFKVGFALTEIFSNPNVIIGRDTRESGESLLNAFCEGIKYGGGVCYDGGILPTACVSYLTKLLKYEFGVEISASHNPKEYNGIKIFDANGNKISEILERNIENKLLSENYKKLEMNEKLNKNSQKSLKNPKISAISYINFVESICPDDFSGLKVLVDCAGGALKNIAPEVLKRYGAEVIPININGEINENAGVLDFNLLRKNTLENNADLGIAFDGDGDRCIACTKEGNILDGDKLLYIFARFFNAKTAVGTLYTNMSIELQLKRYNINLLRVSVGDKHIAKEIKSKGYLVGGEQSGHIIIKEFLQTGDGLISAINLLRVLKNNIALISEASDILPYPQISVNVKTKNKEAIKNKEFKNLLNELEKNLLNKGRIIVRPSGTEPKIRIVVECEDENIAKEYSLILERKLLNIINE